MNRPQLQSDFSRPAGLPTASLHRNLGPIQHEDVSSEAYLLQQEEEWNRKIDDQVDTLQRNMEELIELAKVGNKDQYQVAHESFQSELKAESMVHAASTLLSLSHSMKLMLLLADEREIAQRREEEIQVLRTEIDAAKAKAVTLWEELANLGPLPPDLSPSHVPQDSMNTDT